MAVPPAGKEPVTTRIVVVNPAPPYLPQADASPPSNSWGAWVRRGVNGKIQIIAVAVIVAINLYFLWTSYNRLKAMGQITRCPKCPNYP